MWYSELYSILQKLVAQYCNKISTSYESWRATPPSPSSTKPLKGAPSKRLKKILWITWLSTPRMKFWQGCARNVLWDIYPERCEILRSRFLVKWKWPKMLNKIKLLPFRWICDLFLLRNVGRQWICYGICRKYNEIILNTFSRATEISNILPQLWVMTKLTLHYFWNWYEMNTWWNIIPYRYYVVCISTGPRPLPNRVLNGEQSSVSSFNFQHLASSLRSFSRCLLLLPRLPVPYIFPTATCFRRHLLNKMWPKQLALLLCIVRRMFPFLIDSM